MEVAPPLNHHPTDFAFDFDFDFSAYATTPSTPRPMGDTTNSTAPTSPTRATELHREFEQLLIMDTAHRRTSLATVPFAWEVTPGVPKPTTANLFDGDFAFDVISADFYPDRDSLSVSAEDLFHGGMIKRAEIDRPERGRERSTTSSSNILPSSRSRRTRSLPPFRGFEQEQPRPINVNITPPTKTISSCTTLSASGSGKGSKKWRFKDLFLFRSASDGRALDRDPLKKYSATFRKHDEDFRNSSLRDRTGSGSGSGSGSKRRGPGRVSAHELHYTVNRAVSNDMKKKTFLPYKQGILGRLAFNPTVDALSNGFGFSHNN
ncbi:hypothetical protein SSX86_025423 [Deinandra increscens subsp. villosa]|uniref:Uncharacterized protein n=1 Tax=Deinandra increscens subsp. villosa TaxID=3103831 RepID=A0AAP0GP19_9ASTR